MKWQPIDSAPKDGSKVFLLGSIDAPDRVEWLRVLVIVWSYHDQWTEWSIAAPVGMGGLSSAWFSHWMPLPEPPESV